jgi:hypothetical protein
MDYEGRPAEVVVAVGVVASVAVAGPEQEYAAASGCMHVPAGFQ